MAEELRWEDAWLLLAVLYAARHSAPASLMEVIAAADFINHALPTLGELDGAFARLAAGGWIEVSGLSFVATAKARAVLPERSAGEGSVRGDLEIVRTAIGACRWTGKIPPDPERPRAEGLTRSALDEAVKAYRGSLGRGKRSRH